MQYYGSLKISDRFFHDAPNNESANSKAYVLIFSF